MAALPHTTNSMNGNRQAGAHAILSGMGDSKRRVKVLVPVGMLGAGFPEDSLKRGLELGADVIAVDAGSTDSGPYYLGASQPKTARRAVLHDLRAILTCAQRAGIPVIVGSCGTSGTDAGVDWIHDLCLEIAAEEDLRPRIARIYSEQTRDALRRRVEAGSTLPLPPAQPLTVATVESCEHIVGLMGPEPLIDALEAGADVVLAGRCTDAGIIAALPLQRGMPAGPAWHAGKIAECGSLCTTGNGFAGVLVSIDETGFEVEPLDPGASCTPSSVAAHMLYENADPFRLREPAGWLDVTDATYVALDHRRVRVEGSRFDIDRYTVKLEGSAVAGYQTVSIVGIRDDQVVSRIGEWISSLTDFLDHRIPLVLGQARDDYEILLKPYGYNAVLGDLDTDERPAREIGVVFSATAADQATATSIAKLANPYLLHHALPDMDYLPSWSFASSPAEMEVGRVYAFALNHAVAVETPTELFRLVLSQREAVTP